MKKNLPYKTVIGEAKYSTGNIVSDIVITMYGVTWVLDLSGGSLSKFLNV